MSTVEPRLTDWFDDLNLSIKGDRRAPGSARGRRRLRRQGRIHDRQRLMDRRAPTLYGIPAWAKAAYENPAILMELQKTKHLYAAVLDGNGQLVKGQAVVFWPSGFANLPAPDTSNSRTTQDNTGWATWTLFSPGSDYDPEQRGSRAVVLGARQELRKSCAAVACPTAPTFPSSSSGSKFRVMRSANWHAHRAATHRAATHRAAAHRAAAHRAAADRAAADRAAAHRDRVRLGTWVDDLALQIKSVAERPDQPIRRHRLRDQGCVHHT